MTQDTESSVYAIERPDERLAYYYMISSLAVGPFFPLLLIPRLFKYKTLRYHFDQAGVSMRWGALFRREIRLNYARVQDIHLSSNLIERWLGLGKVELQTASGSAKPEMTLEGIPQVEELRDFFYRRMGGTRSAAPGAPEAPDGDALAAGLAEVTAELAAIRRWVETRQASTVEPGPPDGLE